MSELGDSRTDVFTSPGPPQGSGLLCHSFLPPSACKLSSPQSSKITAVVPVTDWTQQNTTQSREEGLFPPSQVSPGAPLQDSHHWLELCPMLMLQPVTDIGNCFCLLPITVKSWGLLGVLPVGPDSLTTDGIH